MGQGSDPAEGPAGPSAVAGRPSRIRMWTADPHALECGRQTLTHQNVSALQSAEAGARQGSEAETGARRRPPVIYGELLSRRTWKPFQVVKEEHMICFYLWL